MRVEAWLKLFLFLPYLYVPMSLCAHVSICLFLSVPMRRPGPSRPVLEEQTKQAEKQFLVRVEESLQLTTFPWLFSLHKYIYIYNLYQKRKTVYTQSVFNSHSHTHTSTQRVLLWGKMAKNHVRLTSILIGWGCWFGAKRAVCALVRNRRKKEAKQQKKFRAVIGPSCCCFQSDVVVVELNSITLLS